MKLPVAVFLACVQCAFSAPGLFGRSSTTRAPTVHEFTEKLPNGGTLTVKSSSNIPINSGGRRQVISQDWVVASGGGRPGTAFYRENNEPWKRKEVPGHKPGDASDIFPDVLPGSDAFPDNNGGYTGNNGAYPGNNAAYPGNSGAHPDKNGAYPSNNGGYPGNNRGYPGNNGAYPGNSGGYPGNNGAYPGTNGAYPGTNGAYPSNNGAYPGNNGAYPGNNGAYPSNNGAYPSNNGAYPDNNGAYPGNNGAYPDRNGGNQEENNSKEGYSDVPKDIPGRRQNVNKPGKNRKAKSGDDYSD